MVAPTPPPAVISDSEGSEDGDGEDSEPDIGVTQAAPPPPRPVQRPLPPRFPTRAPLASTSQIPLADLPHDYPLPHPPSPWEMTDYQPLRDPPRRRKRKHGAALAIGDILEEEESKVKEGEAAIKKGVEGHRRVNGEWDRRWRREKLVPPGGKGKSGRSHDAAFFPHASIQELGFMSGVAAIVGGDKVELVRIGETSGVVDEDAPAALDVDDGSRIKVEVMATARVPTHDEEPEDLLSCAWTVLVTTWPYTPILAVAGKEATIYIYEVELDNKTGCLSLFHERTLVGHGCQIWKLAFSPSHPHFLVSASDDGTVYLWDPAVEGGADADVLASLKKRYPTQVTATCARPFVQGELLATLTEGGHSQGVLCCDIHPTLPLIVTSGSDAFVKIWTFPAGLRGPAWPAQAPAPPTRPNPSPCLTLGPPIFSSAKVHSGQWVDQVAWASPNNAILVSKAQGIWKPDDRATKLVKVWLPTVLDEDVRERSSSSRIRRRQDPLATVKPERPSSFGFRVFGQAEFLDTNYVGDTIAVHHKSAAREGDETLIVVPTSTHGASLLSFSPFSRRQFTSSAAGAGAGLLDTLFPPTRGRPTYDAFPRLQPIEVTDVNFARVHFRCVTIEPEEGEWMLGVGDGGLRGVWRRKVKVGIEKEEEELKGMEALKVE